MAGKGIVIERPEVFLAKTVDKLGELKAQIAYLTEREAVLREKLVSSGLPVIDGRKFRATITPPGTAQCLDVKRIRAELPAKVLKKFMVEQSRDATVRVVARRRYVKAKAKK